MDLFLKENVKNLLKSRDILPKKNLGQNFLVDRGAIGRILQAADINQDDIVLEIGAGIGNITQELAKKAKKVIAIEKDRKMCEILRKLPEAGKIRNIQIIEDDIRQIINYKLKIENYKVVANIPYYLTAFLIRSLLESKTPPKDMTLVIQKEVAQRICAKPPKMSILAASVQFYAEPKIISYIKKSSFWPVPKVDSAIIKITPHKAAAPHQSARGRMDTRLREQFFKIVRSGFSQPRKQLLNNLSNGLKMDRRKVASWLLQNNIQPTQRAQTLSVENWLSLTKSEFGSIKRSAVLKNQKWE